MPAYTLIERIIRFAAYKAGRKTFFFLARRARIFTFITEQQSFATSSFLIRRGLFSNLIVFHGWYQNDSVAQQGAQHLPPIQASLISQASDWLRNNVDSDPDDCFFLHIRRGDYVHHPSSEMPAVLHADWYRRQMRDIQQANPRAHFVIFSDDIPYVEDVFPPSSCITIHPGTPISDFVAMTQCLGGGILSPSTYAWWAAYYVKTNNPKARLIAPQYWCGWRGKAWIPETIPTPWLEYTHV
jgi:hypothetical protein